jgi:eukaryotic-like serine/threonine-protein kinase
MPRIPWRTVRLYAFTAIAGFLLGWLAVAIFFLPGEKAQDAVVTPNVIGRSLDEARHILDSVGLQHALGDERASTTVPPNAVLAQTPTAGTSVRRLTSVRLDVSAGPRRVRVPSVAGLTTDDAEKLLGDSGLTVATARQEASNAPRGEVLRSRPDAGRWVGQGAAVELIVSAGPSELTMPDVVGRDPGDAMALLRQLGLTSVTVDSSDANGGERVVVSQQPAAGAGIRRSDRVSLRLANRS